MINKLIPFNLDSAPNIEIEGNLFVDQRGLHISYKIFGELDSLDMPKRSDFPKRIVGLWESTCLEAFIKDRNSTQYLEFNFSPSLDWNCYYFEEIRGPLNEFKKITAPAIHIKSNRNRYEMMVIIPSSEVPQFILDGSFQAGICAVIKDNQKSLSYWSLKHPCEKPDFHNPSSFII